MEPAPETMAVYERVTGPLAPRVEAPPRVASVVDARPAPLPVPAAPVERPTVARARATSKRRTSGLVLQAAMVVLLAAAGGWGMLARSAGSGPAPIPDARAVALIDTGMEQYWSGDDAAALESFTEAIAIDPRVPRAHYGVMLAADGLGLGGPFAEAVRAVGQLRPIMTPGQASRVDAFLASPDTARDIYESLMATEPDSMDVVFLLADLEFHWGSFWGVPREDVRAKFVRIEGAGHAEVRALRHLIRMDGAEGDLEAVRRRTQRLEELYAPKLDVITGRTLESVLDPALPVAVLEVAALSPTERAVVVGAVAAIPTHPDRVDRFLADLHNAVPESGKVELAIWNALAAAGRGRLKHAEEWLDSAAVDSPARADEFRAVVATLPWLPADAGRWANAGRILENRRTTLLISPFASDFLADAIYAPRATFLAYMTAMPHTGSASWKGFDALVQKTVIDLALEDAYRRILEGRHFIIAEDSEARGLEVLGAPAIAPDRQRPWLLHHPFAVERFLRVNALYLAGRLEEARGFLRGWPDPSGYDRAYLSWAQTLGGDVAAQRGEWDEAKREYRRAAEMLRGADPAFQPLRNHIARQLEALERAAA